MIPVQPRIFWLTVAVIVMAVIVSKFTPKDVEEIPGGFELAVLGLELARSPQDAATIADGEPRRAILKKNTYADLGLIIAYTILWFTIGKHVNKIVAVAALVAGIADVIEDLGILMTLDLSDAIRGRSADHLYCVFYQMDVVGCGFRCFGFLLPS